MTRALGRTSPSKRAGCVRRGSEVPNAVAGQTGTAPVYAGAADFDLERWSPAPWTDVPRNSPSTRPCTEATPRSRLAT